MTEVERLYQSFDGPIPKHRLNAARQMDEERKYNATLALLATQKADKELGHND